MCRKIYIPTLEEYFAEQNLGRLTMNESQKAAIKSAEEREALDKYICEIGRQDLLTAEEEQTLLAQAIEGDATAVVKILRANSLFIAGISNHYQNRGLSLPQLIEVGKQGLVNAIMSSASKPKEEPFIKFAVNYIRKAIDKAINND